MEDISYPDEAKTEQNIQALLTSFRRTAVLSQPTSWPSFRPKCAIKPKRGFHRQLRFLTQKQFIGLIIIVCWKSNSSGHLPHFVSKLDHDLYYKKTAPDLAALGGYLCLRCLPELDNTPKPQKILVFSIL